MILFAIISLFLGLSVVAFGFILEAKAGVMVAGLVVSVYTLLAGLRMAAGGRSNAALVVGGICGLIPIWVIPFFQGTEQFIHFLPALIASSVFLIAGLGIGYGQERKKRGRKPVELR
ncbi:MAG TPA: hypothetical protein VGL38_07465 [bacterium]|jgi:hypothetical protein